MGHEMGHYVMNHIPKSLMFFLILIVLSFAYLFWGIKWALSRWGERWQISSASDPAVVPLVVLLAGILFFVLTPINNTFTRVQEKEADMFGLNASRQPDGFAQAAIHLGEYRKMRPGPDRGVPLLRSSQRLQPHSLRHGMEEPEPGAV